MVPDPRIPYYDGEKNEVQWVDIIGSEYSVEELDMVKWLKLYGEILSPLSEKLHPDSTQEAPVGNGIYTVKMKLRKPIPQYLPVFGRKIRIDYLGINKSCYNCYGNHTRQKLINNQIEYDLLNKSLVSYKIACKRLFLK